jgi:hypothetical protein
MLKHITVTNEDDHTYYNVNLYNSTDTLQAASFIDRRSIPIIDKCSDYHLSIIRFKLPTYNIPIFVWPGDNYFYFRLTDGIKVVSAPIVLSPVWNDPIFLNGIYQYQDFINLINIQIAALYTANLPWSYPQPPYLYIDTDLNITIFAPLVFRTTPNTTNIKFNLNLYRYFDSFQSAYFPFVSTASPYASFTSTYTQINFEISPLTELNIQNPYITGSASIPGVKFITLTSPVLSWPSLKSIIFTSGGIPIKEEYIQNKLNETNTSLRILTDFEPNVSEKAGDARAALQYTANVYRFIDLISDEPLKTIDISIYWTDAAGTVRPLYISPGQYVSAKLLFKNKYENNHIVSR